MNLSNMRYRDGGRHLTVSTSQGYPWSSVLNDEKPTIIDYTYVTSSSVKDMWDVVTKDFRKRSAKGEIFNNPKRVVSTTFEAKIGHRKGSNKDTYNDTGKTSRAQAIDQPLVLTEAEMLGQRTLFSPNNLSGLAITAAYAGVTANESNAVLWAGEARETVKMVADIGAGLLALYKRTEKQRRAWAKGKLTIPEAQSLTLGILYGILPLEQSIAQVTEGLFNFKPDGRNTSRGFKVHTDMKHDVSSRGSYKDEAMFTVSEKIETVVRAGVLYDIDISKFPSIAIIADPKQVVETAYALARLSFVIDWFINVGNTLKAWSPSFGTVELAAWVSVKETYTQEYTVDYNYKVRETPGITQTGSASGSSSAKLVHTVETREPVSRSDLAIIPRVDINLNMDKLFALVLLFARVKNN